MPRPSTTTSAVSSLSASPQRRSRTRTRTRMVSKLPGDSFFGNDLSEVSTLSSDESVASTVSSSSTSSSSLYSSRGRRMRAVTLLPGSSVHDAFFGADEEVRENFDQEAAVATYANDRRHSRSPRRQTSSSSLKPGRPLLPRYAQF